MGQGKENEAKEMTAPWNVLITAPDRIWSKDPIHSSVAASLSWTWGSSWGWAGGSSGHCLTPARELPEVRH